MIILLFIIGPFLFWGYLMQIIRGLRASNKPVQERSYEDNEIIREGRITALGAIIFLILAIWLYD